MSQVRGISAWFRWLKERAANPRSQRSMVLGGSTTDVDFTPIVNPFEDDTPLIVKAPPDE